MKKPKLRIILPKTPEFQDHPSPMCENLKKLSDNPANYNAHTLKYKLKWLESYLASKINSEKKSWLPAVFLC